jgi:hypothetical protein
MHILQFLFLFQIQFKLRKCKSKDNSKSCQDFFKFEVDKVCDKLAQKDQIWSGFLEDMHIDRKCPLQPVRNDIHLIQPDIYVCMYVNVYKRIYMYIYICNLYTYVRMYKCICLCMSVRIFIRIYKIYKHAMPE